jgi:peptidoglycan hydrolase CwlO-like protein
VEVRVDQVKENAKAQMQQVVSQQQPGNFPVQNLQAQLTSLQQKVQDLEKKIDQMNANIDRLTKELAEKNKTNKKEPKK